jgi:hypothetical protein
MEKAEAIISFISSKSVLLGLLDTIVNDLKIINRD